MSKLQRFIDAQSKTYDTALKELRQGRKTSHWMWYFFPQIEGLGQSAVSRMFSIKSKQEVLDYLNDEVLSQRLKIMTQAVIDSGSSIDEIFGYPDNRKFVSSMTLFAHYAGADSIFRRALERKNGNNEDGLTLELLTKGEW